MKGIEEKGVYVCMCEREGKGGEANYFLRNNQKFYLTYTQCILISTSVCYHKRRKQSRTISQWQKACGILFPAFFTISFATPLCIQQENLLSNHSHKINLLVGEHQMRSEAHRGKNIAIFLLLSTYSWVTLGNTIIRSDPFLYDGNKKKSVYNL